MSTVTDALKKAEEKRQVLRGGNGPKATGYLHSFKQGVLEEVREFEVALTRRSKPQTDGEGVAPVGAATPEAWDQAIERVRRRLTQHEEQVARTAGEQTRLKAQLAANEQLLGQMEQERQALHERLREGTQTAAAIETTKTSLLRQLDALRECQILSHDCRMAEQELSANTTAVSHLTASQQRVEQELAHYRQRGEALEQDVAQLRFKLSQALAHTDTAPTPGGSS